MSASDDPDQEALDRALEALDAGDPEQALGHLEDVDPERGERWAIAAHARIELGDHAGAAQALQGARERFGPAHEDVLWVEGRLDLCQWKLAEARAAFERIDMDTGGAPLLENLALLAELEGDHKRADALYRRAAQLDPEGSPLPPRLSPAQFEELVSRAAADLPQEFRDAL